MSHTPRTHRTTTNDRRLRAVADDPGQQNALTTEDKVRAALAAEPGSATATLALAAGVGRSTAAKILARWDRDGTALRTAGDGPRNPSTWTLAPSGSDPAVPDIVEPGTDVTQPDATATPNSDQTTVPANHTDNGPTPKETALPADTSTDVNDSTAEDTTTVEEPGITPEADDTNAATTAPTDNTPGPSADTASSGTTLPPGGAPTDPVDGTAEPEPPSAVTPAASQATSTIPRDKERLPKGGLRALVEEFLTEHPGEDFGPAKVGAVLGRSGGAVNNALERLVADGYAIKTCEAPKRFTINPDKTDVPAAPGSTQ
jgi:hypothetical protein